MTMPTNPQWPPPNGTSPFIPVLPQADKIAEIREAVRRIETVTLQMWADIAEHRELMRQICRGLNEPGH